MVARSRVIPTGTSRRRQRGNPKPMVAFRCPEDLLSYLSTVPDRTGIIIKMLRIGRDVAEVMGVDWWEVERRANAEGRPIGTILGELALVGLKPIKKTKR